MKKLLFLILISLAVPTMAATVKVYFNYQQTGQNGEVNQRHILDTLKITANNQWKIVQGKKPDRKGDNLILLSKVETENAKQITMDFLVLNTGKRAEVISKPKLTVRFGQKGKLVLKENDKEIELVVMAKA